MARSSKRGRDEVDTYEADDFVEADDGSARKSKKTKKAANASGGKSESKFFEVAFVQVIDWRPYKLTASSSSPLAKVLGESRLLTSRI
jgi:hypothetical protein